MGEQLTIRMSHEGFCRRQFLKAAGLTGLALLTGCAGAQKEIKDPTKFDMKSFLSWYKRNRLYNGSNPNLRSPHSPTPYTHGTYAATFKETIEKYSPTPGLTYSVPVGEVMVASAPGIVEFIEELRTGRTGGLMITVGHPYVRRSVNLQPIWAPYKSSYAHVSDPQVREGQPVERGQILCHVPPPYHEVAKLMLREQENWVDPDNYGQNHSYMQYQTGQLPIDEENRSNQLLMEEKLLKQRDIVMKLDKLRKGGYLEDNLLISLKHEESNKKPQWSTVEKFRFLETLYEMHPHQFPTLPKAELENITKEFYQNQPIILTLPFKKGGLR